jgi:RNA polymerase sigma-70 factor (ECF subfamily)
LPAHRGKLHAESTKHTFLETSGEEEGYWGKTLTDETIKLAATGDSDAFEQLIKRYSKYIVYMCATLTSKEDCEDVAQEVYIAVYRGLGALRSANAFTAWLRKITVRACIAHNRRNARNPLAGAVDIDGVVDTEKLSECDVERLPAEAYENSDARVKLYSLISELSQRQRIILYLYYYEEWKLRTIAAELDISIGTVSSNLTKAKRNLGKLLEKRPETKEYILSGVKNTPAELDIRAAFSFEVTDFLDNETAGAAPESKI